MQFGLRESGTTSKRVCKAVSLGLKSRLFGTHLVHASDVGIIGRSIVLHRDENAVTLCCGNVYHVCFGGLGVDAVNFHDSHSVAFKPKVLTGKSTYVDDAEHVSFSWFDRRFRIGGVIHKGRIWYRLSSRGVGHTDESFHEVGYMIVIPVRKSQYPLLIVLSLVRRVWIIDNQRSAETIRILGNLMRMIPVCTWLVNLSSGWCQ